MTILVNLTNFRSSLIKDSYFYNSDDSEATLSLMEIFDPLRNEIVPSNYGLYILRRTFTIPHKVRLFTVRNYYKSITVKFFKFFLIVASKAQNMRVLRYCADVFSVFKCLYRSKIHTNKQISKYRNVNIRRK